tara:strand:+ start:2889 stop:3569 length:681 start_codon:yes stop_codon:yes gene_type:complete
MKFILYSLPRTGSSCVIRSFSKSGINACLEEPFFDGSSKLVATDRLRSIAVDADRLDHIEYSKKLFEKYDGFKILSNQTMQLLDICDKNNAGLILLKRDYFSTVASLIGLLTENMGHDPSTYNTWTSSGKGMIYDPNIPFFNITLKRFLYHNYLIDNILNKSKNYVTTIQYENPDQSKKDLENYFGKEIIFDIMKPTSLDSYFINVDEFISDIENRLRDMGFGVYI